mmetsp:Transcript_15628/g.44826  ORF Transcript_15628/g.44826 Transcript_15628/m.44826 type:complete len:232 (-) Transcript_15628:8-703(-)
MVQRLLSDLRYQARGRHFGAVPDLQSLPGPLAQPHRPRPGRRALGGPGRPGRPARVPLGGVRRARVAALGLGGGRRVVGPVLEHEGQHGLAEDGALLVERGQGPSQARREVGGAGLDHGRGVAPPRRRGGLDPVSGAHGRGAGVLPQRRAGRGPRRHRREREEAAASLGRAVVLRLELTGPNWVGRIKIHGLLSRDDITSSMGTAANANRVKHRGSLLETARSKEEPRYIT